MIQNTLAGDVTIISILRHILHRYPFVLIDRLESCVPGHTVRMTKLISNDEWFLRDRGDGQRVMPSMLIVEALAQASGALSHYSGLMDQFDSPIMLFAGIDKCRFGIDARPGDTLILECALTRSLRNVVKMSGRAVVKDELVVELALTAVIQDRSRLRQ